MAKEYTTYWDSKLEPKVYIPGSINRNSNFPLDCTDLFLSEQDAERYAMGASGAPDQRGYYNKAYAGQIIGVKTGTTGASSGIYDAFIIQGNGTIKQVGTSEHIDTQSITTSGITKMTGSTGIIGDDSGGEFDEIHTQVLHLCGKMYNPIIPTDKYLGRIDFGNIQSDKGLVNIEHTIPETLTIRANAVYLSKNQLTGSYNQQDEEYQITGNSNSSLHCGTINANGTVRGIVNNAKMELGVPAGSIMLWAGKTAPPNWLLCNGQTISITSATSSDYDFRYGNTSYYYKASSELYRPLVKAIGYIYGYVGTVPHNLISVKLPNLCQYFPIGATSGTISGYNTAIGSTGGEASHQLTYNESGLPAHSHELKYTVDGTGGSALRAYSSTGTLSDPRTTNTETDGGANALNAHNNIPPFLALNYIIKYA